uniref:Alkyl hydroperoxide reductase subunit C/ Thiol specific antioxidant domain-containing protein n=1 Tax=Plectus sambesii TaxID=2011161 RepID=A0A914X356_9BILA
MESKGGIDAALTAAAQHCESILQSCQMKFSETNDLNKFFEYFNKASPHSSLISHYAGLYSILDIEGDQSYFYHMIQMEGNDIDQTMLTRFKNAEKKWDMFVNTIDSLLADERKRRASKSPITLKEDMRFIECGEKMSNITLQNAISANSACKYTLLIMVRYMGCEDCLEHVMAAHERVADFASRNCRLLVVCRATREGATLWRKMIGLQMPVLADEFGDLIQAIDFRLSVAMFANSAYVHKCAQRSSQRVSSRESAYRLDDAHNCIYQLGGDVLIDDKRHVLFVHKSRTPKDRLSIDDLLQKIPIEHKAATVDEELSSYSLRSDAVPAVKFQQTNGDRPIVDIEVGPPTVPITKVKPLRSPPPQTNSNQTGGCCIMM